MKYCLIFSLTFILMVLHGTAQAANPVECRNKIDKTLGHLIEETFANYYIPHLNDLDSQAVTSDIKEGGDGCYVVSKGDFDGNHQLDLVFLLAPKANDKPQLVAALRKDKSWELFKLQSFCTSLKSCYVKRQKSGTYVRSLALDGPINNADERMKIVSKNDSILTGQLESTGVVYVYLNKHWLYVWVSD